MSRLAQTMAFYAAYHQDPRNRATHFVGVPIIVFAILLAMACVPLGFTVAGYEVTLAGAFLAVMTGVYLRLHIGVGAALTAVMVPTLWLAEWVAGMDGATIGIVFAVTFVGGWIIQLVGHKFEGNKPALTQNLLQIFIAPLFLMAEVFFALGLLKQVEADVATRVRAMA